MILETSRMSSINPVWILALRSMISRADSTASRASLPLRTWRTQPRIEVNGVRSSCETIARNSSLVRLAASASRRASCSRPRNCSRSASNRLRSVMSRAIVETPIVLPDSFLIGDIVRETLIRSPALVSQTVS